MAILQTIWSDGAPFTITREGMRLIIDTPRNDGARRTSGFSIRYEDGVVETYQLTHMGKHESVRDSLKLDGINLSAELERVEINLIPQDNG